MFSISITSNIFLQATSSFYLSFACFSSDSGRLYITTFFFLCTFSICSILASNFSNILISVSFSFQISFSPLLIIPFLPLPAVFPLFLFLFQSVQPLFFLFSLHSLLFTLGCYSSFLFVLFSSLLLHSSYLWYCLLAHFFFLHSLTCFCHQFVYFSIRLLSTVSSSCSFICVISFFTPTTVTNNLSIFYQCLGLCNFNTSI